MHLKLANQPNKLLNNAFPFEVKELFTKFKM